MQNLAERTAKRREKRMDGPDEHMPGSVRMSN